MRKLYEGDTIPIRVSVLDQFGAPVNLRDATITFRLAPKPGMAAQISRELTITDSEKGIAELTLTPTDTAGLVGLYHYEITYKVPDSTEEVVAVGTMFFEDTVRGD